MTAGRYDDLRERLLAWAAYFVDGPHNHLIEAAAALRESEEARDRLTDEIEWMRSELLHGPWDLGTSTEHRRRIAAGRPTDRRPCEWWRIGCNTCGHWKVGAFTKDEIADWCRVHPRPVFRRDETYEARESICPEPCTAGRPADRDRA